MDRVKKAVFALFVASQALILILYATDRQPVHKLAPISIAILIVYAAFAMVTWRKE